MLRATAQRLDAPRYEVAAALEQAALAELRERRPDRAIETNVEFWAAVILDFARVPPKMMPAIPPAPARRAGAHTSSNRNDWGNGAPICDLRRPAATPSGGGGRVG